MRAGRANFAPRSGAMRVHVTLRTPAIGAIGPLFKAGRILALPPQVQEPSAA